MDVEAFFRAYGIPYVTEGHKHARPGWVNAECPLCHGNAGYHLGYSKEKQFWCCWRCGFHPEYEVLMAFLGDPQEVMKVRRLYHSQTSRYAPRSGVKIEKVRNCPLPRKNALTIKAQNYLSERRYNPQEIVDKWGIFYGGDFGNLAYRIVIPIQYHGKIISYTARDITGKQANKYLTAPESIQTFNPKHMLYGIDQADNRTVLVVEGPFDVWRFGYGAVCTFGIKWTREQLLLLAKRWKNIKILYDSDRKGLGADRTASQQKAIELTNALSNMGRNVTRCSLTDFGVKDPGDLDATTAKKFMSQLFTED